MDFFRSATVKDLRRIRKDPVALLISVAIPLLVGLLLRLITASGDPTALLLVADHDDSLVSQLLVRAFQSGPLENVVQTRTVTEADGRAEMDAGKASGLLVIPEHFGQDALEGTPTTLSLVTNPAQHILSGILKEALDTFAQAANGLHEILGPEMQSFLRDADTEAPTDAMVARFSVDVNQLVKRAKPFLFPPAIRVETVSKKAPLDERNFAEVFFPSMIFLGLMFAAQTLSDDVWKEKAFGTLRRSLSAPGSLATFFLAKTAAAGVALTGIAVAAFVLGRFMLRIPLHHLLLATIWSSIFAVVMYLFFTVIQTLSQSHRGGNMLTKGILFPLVMAGGTFFPFEMMPPNMARIGRLTPNGWALVRAKEILAGDWSAGSLALAAVVLLAVAAVFYALCLRRLSAFARA